MFYQLRSFDESLPDSVIATQAGLLASSFTGAQFLTAMMWGRISDSEKGGRKFVLLVGLLGTSECEPKRVTEAIVWNELTDV
jgi:MFS family permease